MNVCEAVTSLLIIKWLARSLLFASRIRATPFTHAFHHPYEVADTFIYTYLYTLSLYIISSFTYSLREFDATLVPVVLWIDASLLLFPKLSMFPRF